MRTETFTLKSGTKLTVTMAPFEVAIALVEAVKRATMGWDPGLDVGDAVVTNPEVRRALFSAFDTVLYGTNRVTVGLFDDPVLGEKARGDYFAICGHVITVNSTPFFLTTSSASITPPETTSKSPASP